MKIISAAIFKICVSTFGLNNEEAILTCFDKMVNCSMDLKTEMKDGSTKSSLDKLEKCKGKL